VTPNAPISKTAHLVLDLTSPGITYKAGDNIEGVIKVLVEDGFEATSLSLRLHGVEKASFIPTDNDGKVSHDQQPVRFSESILDVSFKIQQFTKKVEGHLAFPFSVSLPEWLPESVLLKDGTITLAVIYFLTAQLDPKADELFADKRANLSLCRDERIIYVYRKQEE
jgi:hypothetical protein